MKFTKVQKLLKKESSITRLADIAREFNVTPQVVSNWKSRNHVPFKYIKAFKEKIEEQKENNINGRPFIVGYENSYKNEDEMSFDDIFYLAKTIIKNQFKILLFLITVIPFLTMMYVYYFVEPVFTSSSKIILIAENDQSGGLMGLAKEFGVGSNQSSNFSSKEVISEVLRSRRLGQNLINKNVFTEKHGSKNSLGFVLIGEYLNDSTKSIDTRLATSKIIQNISIETKKNHPQTLRLNVRAFEPEFSQKLAFLVLEELKNIIYHFESVQTKNKITFINGRLESVKKELNNAENQLKEFRESNRNIKSSPNLLLMQDRLIREVQVQTQVFITLKNEYELSVIDDHDKDIIFQVLDEPNVPKYKTSPRRLTILIISILISFG